MRDIHIYISPLCHYMAVQINIFNIFFPHHQVSLFFERSFEKRLSKFIYKAAGKILFPPKGSFQVQDQTLTDVSKKDLRFCYWFWNSPYERVFRKKVGRVGVWLWASPSAQPFYQHVYACVNLLKIYCFSQVGRVGSGDPTCPAYIILGLNLEIKKIFSPLSCKK